MYILEGNHVFPTGATHISLVYGHVLCAGLQYWSFLLFCICGWYFVHYFFGSDITALAKDRVYAQIHLDEMSIHQVTKIASFFNFLDR